MMTKCPILGLILLQPILQNVRINPLSKHIKESRRQFHPLPLIVAVLHLLQPIDLGSESVDLRHQDL